MLIAGGIVLGLIILVIGLALTKPSTFRYTRSITIGATPKAVFDRINVLREWQHWSPWEGLDPALKRTYEGQAQGVGAVYGWEGNKKVGAGRMEITTAEPSSKVELTLEFFRPFKATNVTTFSLTSLGPNATVEWALSGQNNFMSKLFLVFVNMDKMLGKDFEKGLAQLKTLVETQRR